MDETEWVKGLSVMLRGTTEELVEWCYYVYDLNGDGGLAREELHHCLRGCVYSGYGVEADELDECERDIVEIGSHQHFLKICIHTSLLTLQLQSGIN